MIGYSRSLVDLLSELRARNGAPSLRAIAARIPSATGRTTSAGYISEVCRGKRIPSGDMAAAIVRVLRGNGDEQTRARLYAEEAVNDRTILHGRRQG